MGLSLQKKNGKYRFWNSVTDSWATKWGSKKEILAYLDLRQQNLAKMKIIEEYFCFPNGWPEKGSTGYGPHDQKGWEPYMKWLKTTEGKDYYKVVDEKYQEILKEIQG